MQIVSTKNLNGDVVKMKTSSEKHIAQSQDRPFKTAHPDEKFGNLFNQMVGDINDLELKATDLTNLMITNPDEVNVHDVQIAAEQAEMGILLTKGVLDRVIRAYKEITSLR